MPQTYAEFELGGCKHLALCLRLLIVCPVLLVVLLVLDVISW